MDHMKMSIYSRQSPATGTDLWCSCTPGLLVYTPRAARRQLELIGWKRNDFPRNRREQGGLLIGRYARFDHGAPIQAEVTAVLEANAECRSPGYIEWSALEEIRMQREFYRMQDELAKTDPEGAEELTILGWWHTHPNDLPIFMSGTDMETQQLKYNKPEKYAVVLNPHRGIWRAFAGKTAEEVPALMLLEEGDSVSASASTEKQLIDRNQRKQNLHQKRCKPRSRKKKRR